MTNATVSISSKIAEGSSRTSPKGYKRYLEYALGSSFELETHLLIAEACNFGHVEKRTSLLNEADEEQKKLISFINKLNI